MRIQGAPTPTSPCGGRWWIVNASVDFVSLPFVPPKYTSVSDEVSSVSTHGSTASVSGTFMFADDVGRSGGLPNDPLLEFFSQGVNEVFVVPFVSFCFPLFDHPILEESFGVSISASD